MADWKVKHVIVISLSIRTGVHVGNMFLNVNVNSYGTFRDLIKGKSLQN